MSHAVDSHGLGRIGNLIDYTVIADANPSVVLRSRKLAATGWSRISGQGGDCANNTVMHLPR